MTVLRLHQVDMTYGRGEASSRALKGVSLQIQSAETVALVGSSGSGKTTLLNLAAGLERPTAGHIELLGQRLDQLNQAALARLRQRSIGFVFQAFNLLAGLTAWQNVELPLVLAGWARGQRRRRVAELLDSAGLAAKHKSYPMELSTGQQQRVAVLRALAHKPAIVMLDEPSNCLDSHHAGQLADLVLDLNQQQGATILLATHDMGLAHRLGRIVRLEDGRIDHPHPSLSPAPAGCQM